MGGHGLGHLGAPCHRHVTVHIPPCCLRFSYPAVWTPGCSCGSRRAADSPSVFVRSRRPLVGVSIAATANGVPLGDPLAVTSQVGTHPPQPPRRLQLAKAAITPTWEVCTFRSNRTCSARRTTCDRERAWTDGSGAGRVPFTGHCPPWGPSRQSQSTYATASGPLPIAQTDAVHEGS